MQKCRKIQTLDASVKLWDAFKILGRKASWKAFPSCHKLWQNHGCKWCLPLSSSFKRSQCFVSWSYPFLTSIRVLGGSPHLRVCREFLFHHTWPVSGDMAPDPGWDGDPLLGWPFSDGGGAFVKLDPEQVFLLIGLWGGPSGETRSLKPLQAAVTSPFQTPDPGLK